MYFESPCRLTKRQHNGVDGTWSRFGFPLGNGSLGTMLGGEVFQEVIQFNEETLVNGGPLPNQAYHHGNREEVSEYLREIQELLLKGKKEEATELCKKHLIGLEEGYGAYQNLGELVIGYQYSETEVTEYRRELDLETAIHQVTFKVGENQVERQSFMSHPDHLFVEQVSSQEGIDLFFCFQTEHPHQLEQTSKGFCVKGYLADNHLQFAFEVALDFSEGELTFKDGDLRLSRCQAVTILGSAVTDYAPIFPSYRQEFPLKLLEKGIQQGMEKGFNQLKERHIADYQGLFQRVTFELGEVKEEAVEKIMEAGGLALAEMLYHFGRYLLIASSRPGGLPSNLQGLWNETNNPPWGSDYHLNVNLQMNYWGAAGGNLLESIAPLVDYVEHLREPGRLTAAAYHGIVSDEQTPENGFTAHTQTTLFGFTGPGWDFEWGWSPAVIPWILDNLYDTYLFTLDDCYLEKIYPIMREATRFFEQALIYNPEDGYYYSAPAYSPEHGPITLGNVYEHTLIQQLILNTIASSQQLGLDREKVPDWQKLAQQIRTEEIGAEGQLKEWFEETTLGSVEKFQREHRHVSHLLGVYPLHRIPKNSKLAAAAEKSLLERGLGTTGWSMIHRGLVWARLGNGEKVAEILSLFFEKCLHENLFATHPPFQIDANLGYIALVQEALFQSRIGQVTFLPALPPHWTQGKITGLRGRGNLCVDLSWENQQLQEARIEGEVGQVLEIVLLEEVEKYHLFGGEVIESKANRLLVIFEKTLLQLKRKHFN